MRKALALLENETLKVLRRRRFRVVLLVLSALLSVVVFAQSRQGRGKPRGDWRPRVERRVAEMDRRLKSGRMPEGFARFTRWEAARLRYHLEKNVDPDAVSGPLFSRTFAGVGSVLLLPLLVAVVGADLVSSEFAEGTIALLLTRPVARWKVLASKVTAMGLFTTLTVGAALVLSWGIAGFAFGWAGWNAPSLTGFRVGTAGVDPASVRTLPLWQDTLAAYGLAWISALCVGSVTVLLSVLFRSTAAAMGTMMATLIGGTILSRVASEWDAARYFFVTNLPLAEFYTGMPTPFDGMTLGFSVTVLAVWAGAALAAAFSVFTRRDVTA